MATYIVLFADGTTSKVKAWDKSEAWEKAIDSFSKTIVDVWIE